MNKIFKRIKCTGKESSLDECEQIRSENGIRCSKRILVAGVVCSSGERVTIILHSVCY